MQISPKVTQIGLAVIHNKRIPISSYNVFDWSIGNHLEPQRWRHHCFDPPSIVLYQHVKTSLKTNTHANMHKNVQPSMLDNFVSL